MATVTTGPQVPLSGGTMTGPLVAPLVRVEGTTNNKAGIRLLHLDASGAAAPTSFWELAAENHVWSDVTDHTLGIAFNQDGSIATQPIWGENWESRFKDAELPNGYFEKNWSFTSMDRNTSYRPLNFWVNLNTNKAGWEFRTEIFNIHGAASDLTADSTFYIDTDDRAVSVAKYLNIGSVAQGGSYPLHIVRHEGTRGVVLAPTNAANGDISFDVRPNAVTGTLTAFGVTASVSGQLDVQITNSGAGVSVISINSGSGGDAYTCYSLTDTFWSVGGDRSASKGFAISKDFVLGSNDALTIDTSLHTTFGGAIKPKSYTVATLPSASTRGAGAKVYCTDASGGAVGVQSNGTNWKLLGTQTTVS